MRGKTVVCFFGHQAGYYQVDAQEGLTAIDNEKVGDLGCIPLKSVKVCNHIVTC
jgi:hypothetical protein